MKRFFFIMLTTIGLFSASAMQVKFQALSGFPSGEAGIGMGVSASFSGIIQGKLILAGGCNFPEVSAADGGAKKFYKGIYLSDTQGTDLNWIKVGEMPAAAAYGVAVPYENSLIFAGGNNTSGGVKSVYRVSLTDNQKVSIENLPDLPWNVDNMSGAIHQHKLFLFGGKQEGVPSRKLLSLDLKNTAAGWKIISEIPGLPRVQPVMVASGKSLYIWGGFTSAHQGVEPAVFTDGYKFDVQSGKWLKLKAPKDPSGKEVTLGGAAGVSWNDSLLVFAGGVNPSIFLSALQREATLKGEIAKAKSRDYLSHPAPWYQFNKNLLIYHVSSDKWKIKSTSERFARAGASLITDQKDLFLIGGETKPGIRSTDITRISSVKENDFTSWVNPFIGTGGHGHTFPGPVALYGMIQPGPDTRIFGWDACSGYYYNDTTINGFSHTHLSGTGCGDYGDYLLMPTVGQPSWKIKDPASQTLPYASRFSHDKEVATPGYYSVYLDDYKVKAELTATPRAAMHRYTFPASKESGFILDLDYSLQGQKNNRMEVEVIGDTIIRAFKNTTGWAWDHQLCLYAVFSKPFQYTLVEDTLMMGVTGQKSIQKKLLIRFETSADEVVKVKLAISAVDVDGAEKNLRAEMPGWDFDGIVAQTQSDWNKHLGKIKISTPDQEQKTIFYTALYHTGISPSLYSDVDGRYRGMDKKIRQSDNNNYTIYSLWDTFRAFHPLLTITDPQKNNEFIESLMGKYREGGIFPMWELASNYTGTMIGYHAVPVVVDAWMKGDRNIAEGKALLKACLRSAEYDTTGILSTKYVRENALMPKSKWYKNTLGFIPCDSENESVAKALEYAYNDWCIARLAEALNETKVKERYDSLALNYTYYYDRQTGFMRGKYADGSWRTPFSPNVSTHRNDDYCEGTAWQWTWFVPHDVNGLKKLMGGEDEFLRKLNLLFSDNTPMEGETISADISGLIGQYAHGNEPSHHIIHLYNYTKENWRTQWLADSVLYHQYRNAPDGLSGNEDCGQMSAWYILNAMGFYQIAPGNPVYSIGRPLFDQVEIPLSNGKIFSIKVYNNSRENKYIRSVKLNGKELTTPFFTHQDILNGGKLEFEMSPTVEPMIIPRPNCIEVKTGKWMLPEKLQFFSNISKADLKTFQTYLQNSLFTTEIQKVQFVKKAGKQSVQLLLTPVDDKNESYQLTIDETGVVIKSGSYGGLFYGFQSFLQSIGKDSNGKSFAPYLAIHDSPRFEYRGFMMDVSRHFYPVDFIKKQLDAMAFFKMNRFHWHLTDGPGWRIEIKKYPRLTDFAGWRTHSRWKDWWKSGRKYSEAGQDSAYGGFYTQKQIREVVQYASQRNITVIPEIEMPGHSEETLAAYPFLSCAGEAYKNDDFCAGKDSVFNFIEDVLTEVIDLFPSGYIHIGGDEAGKTAWKNCPHCIARMKTEGLKDVDELQSYFVNRVAGFLQSKGRKMIGWDEITTGKIPQNAAIMSWRGEEGGIKALQAGLPAIMTPGQYCYLDFYQDVPHLQPEAIGGFTPTSKVYGYEPVSKEMKNLDTQLLLGVQGNLWTEFIAEPEHAEMMIFPRLMALSEVGWTQPERKSWGDFYQRVLPAIEHLKEKSYAPFDLKYEMGNRPESNVKVSCLSTGKKAKYLSPYNNTYAAGGDTALTDGWRGGWSFTDKRWQGFISRDRMHVVIDLEKTLPVREISFTCMQQVGPEIYLPSSVQIEVSSDGINFTLLEKNDYLVDLSIPTEYRLYQWEGNVSARYIKIKAGSSKEHGGWIFTDEIIVN